MIGLLCPGQGSQLVGMGRDIADAYPTVRSTFQEADDALDFGLSSLCWEGHPDELTLTQNAQPAILVHSIAVWRLLTQERPTSVALAAGHSLGEFSAYVTAGAIGFRDAVRLVRRRGELMYHAGRARPGSMAAVLGLDDAAAEMACREASESTGSIVVPANYNSPGQIVVSGDVAAVARLDETARAAGARRMIALNVSGAFHSPLMAGAVDGLREALDHVEIGDLAFPVVSNVTAEPVSDPGVGRDLLVRQLTSPVRWVDCVRNMAKTGVTHFLEIGPGGVLSRLVRRIDRAAIALPLGTLSEIEKYIAEGV